MKKAKARKAGKAKKPVKASKQVKARKAKKAKVAGKPRMTAALPQAATTRAAAAHPKGCCTIAAPSVPDRDSSGVTEAECNAIANAHPGSVANWVEGSCA